MPETLRYHTNGELREEIAYTVGSDPTRYGAGSERGLRKKEVARLAERLRPDGEELDVSECDLATLYDRVCEWAGGEYQPNAGNAWGINRDNLKHIHRAIDATEPREVVMTDGGRDRQQGTVSQSGFVDAQKLLPHGAMLSDLPSGSVYVVVHTANIGFDRRHWWIARDGEEFVGVKRTPSQKAVVRGELEKVLSWLDTPDFYDAEQVLTRVVDRDQTPLPYDLAPNVRRECPECGAWGQMHEWKWQRERDTAINGCSCCDFGGELRVSRV
jgi:hypothetical protein